MNRNKIMKRLFARKFCRCLVFAFVFGAGCASGPGVLKKVEVVRVWPEYRAAGSFDRISEYFTGRENTGGRIVLRTQTGARAGFYFFIRMKTPANIEGARVVIDVIMPDSAEPETFSLPAPPLRKGTVLLNPGVTGGDWSEATARPTAWRLRLLAADGSEIFARQSYLWSK